MRSPLEAIWGYASPSSPKLISDTGINIVVDEYVRVAAMYLDSIRTGKEVKGCAQLLSGASTSIIKISGTVSNDFHNFHHRFPHLFTMWTLWLSIVGPESTPPPTTCTCDRTDVTIDLIHSMATGDPGPGLLELQIEVICLYTGFIEMLTNDIANGAGQGSYFTFWGNTRHDSVSWPRSVTEMMPLGVSTYVKTIHEWLRFLHPATSALLIATTGHLSRLGLPGLLPALYAVKFGRSLNNWGHAVTTMFGGLVADVPVDSNNGTRALGAIEITRKVTQFDTAAYNFIFALRSLASAGGDPRFERLADGAIVSSWLCQLVQNITELYFARSVVNSRVIALQGESINERQDTSLALVIFLCPKPYDLPEHFRVDNLLARELLMRARRALALFIHDDDVFSLVFATLLDYISATRCNSITCETTWLIEVGSSLVEPPRTGLMRCGACKMVAYCGKECQKRSWKGHKEECTRMQTMKGFGLLDNIANTPPSDFAAGAAQFRTRCLASKMDAAALRLLFR